MFSFFAVIPGYLIGGGDSVIFLYPGFKMESLPVEELFHVTTDHSDIFFIQCTVCVGHVSLHK